MKRGQSDFLLKKKVLLASISRGIMALTGLLLFYLLFLGLIESFELAFYVIRDDVFFVAAISLGFGVQMGLLSYSRRIQILAQSKKVVALGTSGTGASSLSMVACCLHHVSDVLPFFGISAAVLFFENYRYPFMWMGVLANLVGIILMVRILHKNRLWPRQIFTGKPS